MKFEMLTREEFISISEVSQSRNFFQSIYMYDRYVSLGEEVYLVGIKDDSKVVCGALLVALRKKIFGYKIFNCYKGFLCDFNNRDLVKYFSDCLYDFVKSKKGIRLYIDPYVLYNDYLKSYLCKIGYKYVGEYEQVKYVYVKDLDKGIEETFKSFKSNTRNYINKTLNKYFLKIDRFSYDELKDFKNITLLSSNRHNFLDKELSYYESMYNSFKDKVLFLKCYIDKEYTLSKLYDIRNNKNMDVIDRDICKVKSLDGNKILSVGMFMLFGDEIVYLFSGNNDNYMNYYGSYLLQWYMIQYGINNGFKRYNFYGVKLDGNDGVLEFKKGFNGYVEELLGTFYLNIGFIGKIYEFYKKYL